MTNFSKTHKRKSNCEQQVRSRDSKQKHVEKKSNFISMSEARQLAEHVFSGIAWNG